MKKNLKHLLTLQDFTEEEIKQLLQDSRALKSNFKQGQHDTCLQGKTLAMLFEKASTRTRVSFEVAMFQLGGHALYVNAASSQLGRGETIEDTARVLSRYVDAMVYRTFSQENLERLAATATVPVLNGLSDLYHPIQVLADLQTILEQRGSLENLKVTYVGDGNNLTHSWMNAASQLGFEFIASCPENFGPDSTIWNSLKTHSNLCLEPDAQKAVKDCDVIYTDTWFSMGQEQDPIKLKALQPYQVNAKLLAQAIPNAMVLHCLPAHRGEEITDEVLDGPQSQVWNQAENRLHLQKALLKKLVSEV